MASKSKIEWTESTWNPVAGCTKCSPGCDNCYAERMAARLANMMKPGYCDGVVELDESDLYIPKWTGEIIMSPGKLEQPMNWRRGRRIFVNSMSDTFHPKVPFEYVDKIFAIAALCPQHTLQILTKRVDRMLEYITPRNGDNPDNEGVIDIVCYMQNRNDLPLEAMLPIPNVHLGVSICTPDELWKLDVLRKIPAAVRFVSFEPLLGDMGKISLGGIGQVIVGGESGPGARPMQPDWVRSIRDQCGDVPFFFKQWGEWLSGADKCALKINTYQGYYPKRVTRIGKTTFFRVTKKKAGNILDGVVWEQYPKGGE